jgi:putative ABC transport system permease protein
VICIIYSLTTYSPQNYTQPASYPEYLDWRRDTKSFSALAAYNNYASVNFENGGTAIALPAVSTSDNFFDVFGVKPILGRTFVTGEELPGCNFVVVLSNEVWRSLLGARPGALGAKVKLDGISYTVIGACEPSKRWLIACAAGSPQKLAQNRQRKIRAMLTEGRVFCGFLVARISRIDRLSSR